MGTVIGLAGGIGSGKTNVARELARVLGCRFVSFGDYVREEARRRGLDQGRDTLQSLGKMLPEKVGWDTFVASVLGDVSNLQGTVDRYLVVDGIRHVEGIEAIKHHVAPIHFRVVFLDVPRDERASRLTSVRPSDAAALERLERHPTEAQVLTRVRAISDLLLDGNQPVMTSVGRIMNWLHR